MSAGADRIRFRPGESDPVNRNVTAQLRLSKPVSGVELFVYDARQPDGIGAPLAADACVKATCKGSVIDVVYEGRYQITVDYLDPDEPDISGPALQFQVSNEEKFRNDTYGFLAVVKSDDATFTYTIEHFLDEEAYWNYLDNGSLKRENVILEFQGLFSQQKRADGSHAYLGVSNNDSHNVMTLNGALDIRSGTCTITETNGSVKVDFDADIYTTGSNTYVHTGVAALTELEKGEDYALIPYSEDGDRQAMTADTIASAALPPASILTVWEFCGSRVPAAALRMSMRRSSCRTRFLP